MMKTSLLTGSPIMASMTSGNMTMFTTRNPFVRVLALTVFCMLLLVYTLRPAGSAAPALQQHFLHVQNGTQPYPRDCNINSTHLRTLQERYDLDDTIDYARRYIRFRPEDIKRKTLTKIDKELFPRGFEAIDIQNPPMKYNCLKPLEVPVPKSSYPKTVDASDLLFGISTTYARLTSKSQNPVREWAHFLTDGNGKSNGAGLVLRLIDASVEEIHATEHMMKELGIDVKVFLSDGSIEMAKRYLSLVPALYNDSSRLQRKFFVMCDDDTFFPSMHTLLQRLAEYDHKTDLYIGTLSEDVNNINRHGSQAFGGAGVFFSVSLAEKIAGLYEECSTDEKIQQSNSGWGPQGDILLRKCIYEHTQVRLTLFRELHQLDIMGDPSGFYESGVSPLSLHHYKGGLWYTAYPYEGSQVIHACGEDCFLQRFQTNDDFIINNGYSVAYYPKGIDFNIHQMERTFHAAPDDFGWNLDFMLGPQRESLLRTGRKAAWELRESSVEPDGSVLQTYIRKGNDPRWTEQDGEEAFRMFESDGVIELVWIST